LREHQRDDLTGGIEQLERRHRPGRGRLGDHPGPGDQLLAQVQVEGRVEHVQPAVDPPDPHHRTAVDLDAAAVADEDHDGPRGLTGVPEDDGQRLRRHLPGAPAAGQAKRLGPGHAVAAQHREELVGVSQRVPVASERGRVDLGVGASRGAHRRRQVQGRRGGRGTRRDQRLPGRPITVGLEVDLMDRGAGAVEHLDAAAHAIGSARVPLGDRQRVAPVRQEHPQIDRLAVDQAGPGRQLDPAIAPAHLTHRGRVARERHAPPDRWQAVKQGREVAIEPARGRTDLGGREL
jgi:hypothetical protein